MADPFSVLIKTLNRMFRLEAIRNNKYTCNEVQHLDDAIRCYNPKVTATFYNLLGAVRKAMPFIEKWNVDFNKVKSCLDSMAKQHQTPPIDWNKFLTHPKISPKFQFSALNNTQSEHDLNALIKVTELNNAELTQAIIDKREQQGFSSKLLGHLKKEPGFLFDLILKSKRNFTRISKTRLILYLTDEQLAHAIIKHLPEFLHNKKEPFKNPFEEVEQVVDAINKNLSKGRSISTLLRNTDAKLILEQSAIFQMYQSEEYIHRHDRNGSESQNQDSDTLFSTPFNKL